MGKFSHLWLILIVFTLLLGQFFCSCSSESNHDFIKKSAPICADSVLFTEMQYSKMFRLGTSCGADMVEIRSFIGRDTLMKRFVLVDSAKLSSQGLHLAQLKRRKEWKNAIVLQMPLTRVVALSSSHVGYMASLCATEFIVGVGDVKYIVDSTLYLRAEGAKLQKEKLPLAQLGNGLSLDYEKLVLLKPNLVMTFATGGSEDDYARLEALGVPVMLTSEWQENSPLAKAEWVKLYGMLFCKNEGLNATCANNADSIFEQSKKKYESQYKMNASGTTPRPRVLAGMVYGGIWYAPGGKSYTAKLIHDAGGQYLWEHDTHRELKLSLEEILVLSDSIDVWLNPGAFASPEEILAAEPRVKKIKAFKEGRVYQNDARKGLGGGNDFYEGAVVKPCDVLKNVTECIYFDTNTTKKVNLNAPPYKWYRNIFKL